MLFEANTENVNFSGNKLKKYRKKKRILQLIYEKGALSAPQIGKGISVSLPTSMALISDLVSSNYIVSEGVGKSKGGRKPLIYGLAKKSLFAVACDMGRYFTRMTIFNPHNQQITSIKKIETNIDDPKLEQKLFDGLQELLNEFSISYETIFGVGIDMPGLVDSEKGVNYTVKGELLQNIKSRLEKKFNKLVYIDNDARMQAFGEFKFGKAKGKKNAIVINWNWGIGLGMILNGKIYRGTTGFAGEFSHIKMEDNGNLCICGKNGCLETVASAHTLLRYAKEGISQNIISQLNNQNGETGNDLKVEHIISAARKGDEFSISILSRVGAALGKGLSYIIQLLNPEIIVIAGTLAEANQFVLTPIQQSLNKHCLEKISANTEIVISDLSENSGLLGVAAKLYQKIFSDMIT